MLHLETSDSDTPIFRTPAEGGWHPAQNDYGVIHAEGVWVEQDRAEAVKWFRKAATGGRSRGQHDLAVAYHNDGALVVTDEIAPRLPFPWARVIWMPGEQSMQPVDFSDREASRFRT